MIRFLEDVTVATDEELWAPAMWTDISETVTSVATQCHLPSGSTVSLVHPCASHDKLAAVSATFVTSVSSRSIGTSAPCQYFNMFDSEIVDVRVEHRNHGDVRDDISGAFDPMPRWSSVRPR